MLSKNIINLFKEEKPRFLLGISGLIPFLLPALGIWFLNYEYYNYLFVAFKIYASLIITFLSGIHWGIAMGSSKLNKAIWPYVLAILPSIIVFCLNLYDKNILFLLVIFFLFNIVLILDYIFKKMVLISEFYFQLRIFLTISVNLSILSFIVKVF